MDSAVKHAYRGLVVSRAAEEIIGFFDSESKNNDGVKSKVRCADNEERYEAERYYKVVSVLHRLAGSIYTIETWSENG